MRMILSLMWLYCALQYKIVEDSFFWSLVMFCLSLFYLEGSINPQPEGEELKEEKEGEG